MITRLEDWIIAQESERVLGAGDGPFHLKFLPCVETSILEIVYARHAFFKDPTMCGTVVKETEIITKMWFVFPSQNRISLSIIDRHLTRPWT